MQNELETVAWVKQDGRHVQVPVGLWIQDEAGNDITTELEQDEYDLLYEKATRHAVEQYTDAAEYLEER